MAWDRDKEKRAGKAMGIGASIFAVLFAIFWCILAASMGAWFMLVFGIPFVSMAVYRLYVCIQYAKADSKSTQQKQTDPWDHPVPDRIPPRDNSTSAAGKFCPYCGGGIQDTFEFCPKCGRRQP